MRGSAITVSVACSMVLGMSVAPAFAQAAAGQAAPKPAQTAPAAPAPPVQAAPAAPAPFPAGAKIGYINPQLIFSTSIDGKAGLARIQTLTQKKQGENTARQKALADNQQKLQASGGVMSDAARSALEKEIEKQNTDMQRFQQDAQAEINELQQEVQNEFVKKLSPIVEQLATEKGLHLVFNASESGIAWATPGLDLTGEVIKKLDALSKPGTAK